MNEDSPPKIDYLQQQQTMNNLLNKAYSMKMDKTNSVLFDHNLIKYELPKDVNTNLFEALSMAQYFTINYGEEIKNLFINYVKNLLSQQSVPKKLSIFTSNLSLFKDYNTNPTFTGFQKINFELSSMIFKKKIIVYQVQEETQLLAHFYNNQFEPAIQLLKHGQHYDILYSIKEFESISICQEILLEICETKLNLSFDTEQQEQNTMNIINKNQQTQDKIQQQQEQSPKSPNRQIASKAFDSKSPTKHKKSMSDSFNKANDNNFTLFSNLKVPEDFLQTLSTVQGQQQEPKKDYFSDMFAIQNYNVSTSKVTSPGNSMIKYFDYGFGSNQNFPLVGQDVVPIHENEGQENDQDNYQKILNESMTQNVFPYEDEIIQGNHEQHQEYNNGSSCHSPSQQLSQLEQMPSNLQNNANYDNYLFNENLFTKKKLAVNPNENDQIQPHISSSPPPIVNQSQQFPFVQAPNYYMMQNQISQSSQQQQQQQQFNFYQQQAYQQQQYQSPQQQQFFNEMDKNFQSQDFYSNRKKGPVIVDESKQRYTGKLKFFDEQKSYGFIVKDDDNSDVFLHFDDLTKAGISQEVLQAIRSGKTIRFEFCCLGYMGKYNRSRKAIDLIIHSIE